MGWFQKNDDHDKWAAADLISGISPQLDGPPKQTLLNLVRNGNEKNIRTILEILKKFPEDSHSDELCKEAVKYSNGERKVQDRIEHMIVYRPRGSSGVCGPIRIFQRLKERLCSWLEDENQYVRDFAQRAIKIVETRIKDEEKQAKETEIQRRKGLL